MIVKEKISTVQLFSLLFISRILVTLTYVPQLNVGSFDSDLFLSIPISFVLMVLLMLPMYFLLKGNREISVPAHVQGISKRLARGFYLLYFIFFAYNAATAIARFALYSTSELQPQASSFAIALIIILVASYIAWLGIEPIARSSMIITVVICIGTIMIFVGTFPRISRLNFSPLFYDGAQAFAYNIISSFSQTVELAALALLVPMTSGKIKKGFFIWLGGLLVFLFMIVFSVVGVLGEFSEDQLFPVYTATVLSEFNLIQRLDALQTGIWLTAVIVKAAYLVILCDTCLGKIGVPSKSRKTFFPVSGMIILIFAVICTKSIGLYTLLSDYRINLILSLILVFVIPLFALGVNKIKQRRRDA